MATEGEVRCWTYTSEALAKLENLLACGKCGHLLTEPCSLGSCEHFFCRSCVWRDVGNSCPVCDMPAWVKDLQTNRRLATLVSLSAQLRDILEMSGKQQTDNDVQKTGKSVEASVDGLETEETVGQKEDREIEEQEDSTVEALPSEQDHKGVAEEVPNDQPCRSQSNEQDHTGMIEDVPDDEPHTSQPDGLKTILKTKTPKGATEKNATEGMEEDIPELSTLTLDHDKKAIKEQGRYPLTLRARTKKSYAEDNDSSEAESEREPANIPAEKSPDPLSVFDFHGSPTRPKKASKPKGKKVLKTPAMFFKPASSQPGRRSGQVTKERVPGRRLGRVTKERLADMNQQWGFSASGRKKKGGRKTSLGDSQGDNSFARRVSFAVAGEAGKSGGMKDEGIEEATVEEAEESGEIKDGGIKEAVVEEAESAGMSDEEMDEALTEESGEEDMIIDIEENKEPGEDDLREDKQHAQVKMTEAMEPQEAGKKGEEEIVATEADNCAVPEDAEMPQVDRCEGQDAENAVSPSSGDSDAEAGKKRRRSGRLGAGVETTRQADMTSHLPDPTLTPVSRLQAKAKVQKSASQKPNSPQGYHTPRAVHDKKRKSPMARKTLLSEEEEPDTPLKKVHKKLSKDDSSPKGTKVGVTSKRKKTADNLQKTATGKDESKVNISPASTPQSRAGSKGRRSSVLTPRGQRFSPRGSPGHVMKKNVRGETLLHLAAIKGDAETVSQLLKEGADPNVKDNAGWTPLHEASNHGHTRVAEVLLDHGALINVTAFENDSPLHDAVQNGRVEVARLLVSRGASLDVRNITGFLPGDYARTAAMREALSTKPLHTQPQVVMATNSQVQQVVALATGLDTKQREALEQCMLVLDGKVARTFSDQVTHLVTACDDNGRCPRTIKYLRGVLTGKWIINFKWVTACLEQDQHVEELPYEVQGTIPRPDSTGASKGRLNRQQQLPGLFDGCHFFLHGKFQSPTPPRRELVELIQAGGGGVLSREPKPDSDCTQASTTVPYHARPDSELAHCSHFILYDTMSAKAPPKIRTAKLCTVPVSWLMDCVTDFCLVDLPY